MLLLILLKRKSLCYLENSIQEVLRNLQQLLEQIPARLNLRKKNVQNALKASDALHSQTGALLVLAVGVFYLLFLFTKLK